MDGKANQSVVRTIADELHIAPSRVVIVAGAASRTKVINVEGMDAAVLEARWPGLLTST